MAFESSKVRSIKKALKRHGGSRVKFVKFHGTEFSEAGTPDLIGCYRRVCFVLECKNERGRLSEIQKVRLKEWEAAGAETGVPRSAEDALKVLRRIDEYQDHAEPKRARHSRQHRTRVRRTREEDTGRTVRQSARDLAISTNPVYRTKSSKAVR